MQLKRVDPDKPWILFKLHYNDTFSMDGNSAMHPSWIDLVVT